MVFIERDITPDDNIQIELSKTGSKAIVEKDGKVFEMGSGGSPKWIRAEARRIAEDEIGRSRYGGPVRDVRVGSGVAIEGWKPGSPVVAYPMPTQIWMERLNPGQVEVKDNV